MNADRKSPSPDPCASARQQTYTGSMSTTAGRGPTTRRGRETSMAPASVPARPQSRRLAFDLVVWTSASVVSLALLASEAFADSHRLTTATNPTLQAECGSCHVAYPPSLLPARDWKQIMATLGRHYGSDASVDAKTAAEIERFLVANAGRDDGRAAQSEPRITTTQWFLKEHRKVASALAGAGAVEAARSTSGSAAPNAGASATTRETVNPANCAACHPDAARGDYDEHAVRVPIANWRKR